MLFFSFYAILSVIGGAFVIDKVNLEDINYIQYGNSKGKYIVLLHGWGQNI